MTTTRLAQSRPAFRLARVLEERKTAEKSYYRLAEAISKAYAEVHGSGAGVRHAVDRRKLQKIVENGPEGMDLTLTLKELHAINAYLDQFGEGLAHNPVFERVQVLRRLAAHGNVDFLLASRPQVDSMDLSHWDVKSLAVIQRATNQISRFCRFDQHDVLLRNNEEEARGALALGWLRRLLGDSGPGLVCIGSPRASHAAEAMLATMLGYEAFVSPEAHHRPPFLFAWSAQPEDGRRLPSCVAIRAHDLRRLSPPVAARVGEGEAWAMLVGERVYVSEFPCEQPTKAYGIVAVQQRPSGQIWMVVAGLSGIGTYATALAVAKIQDNLPRTAVNQASPVLWAAVEAEVVLDTRRYPLKIPRLVPNRPIAIVHGPELTEPVRLPRTLQG